MGDSLLGAQIVLESLMREGVEVVFGVPGGASMPIYDAWMKYEYPVKHVLATHEQGASHMADGYARATGRVGVCMSTSGPGATNLVTGIATAAMDSSSVVAITSQVTTSLLGRDGFQEADVSGITLPITKHNYLVTNIRDLARVIKEAFYIARTGRPGPVLVDICKDVLQAETEFVYPETVNLPGYHPVMEAAPGDSVEHAAELINSAERPLIISGRGVSLSGAEAELLELVEKANIPVATTLLGIGTISETHPLCMGMGGMHGEAFTNMALQNCDVMVVVGSRLDDRLTGVFSRFATRAKLIHIELDVAEINKNLGVEVALVGDARLTLKELLPLVKKSEHSTWLRQIAGWKEETDRRDILAQEGDELVPPFVIREIWHATGEGDCLVVSDVGQHQMWEAQYFLHRRRRGLITSGGLGTMGFSLPASIGAQFGRPEEEVWVIAGDGGFQMTMSELSTVHEHNLPIKIAIMENGFLGMVRQWQDIYCEKRFAATPLHNPDFVKLADAYGIPALKVTTREEVLPAIKQARAHKGPFLVDFQVDPMAMVFPMVGPGKANDEMLRRPLPEECEK